jgi:C1A family cysteine protease
LAKKSKKVLKKGMGWRPDLPDQRDKEFKMPLRLAARIPSKVDLRDLFDFPLVEDQGELGSCTANALVGAMEYIETIHKEVEEYTDLSRLFIYYNERLLEGSIDEDAGAYIRDGIKTLYRKGVCSESSWPYDINRFTETPDKSCYTEAKSRKIVLYQRIKTLDQMRACLATKYPFVFGFTVYDSFLSSQVADTGTVPMPTRDEVVQGGHAVLCVGYDDRDKRFICRNSWGNEWGDHGYFTMPYAYLTNRDLSDDMWAIRM